MEQVVVDYLKDLGISVSEEYCKKIIVSHPDFPSLLGVSDALERLGIPSQIGRIEEEHLSKVAFPFLIHLESSRDGLVLIKNKEDLSKGHIDLTRWEGIVLKAEHVTEIKDTEHNRELKKERLAKKALLVLASSLLGALLILLLQTFSWISLALLSTSIAGVIVGYILIAKELGVTFKPVESFCNTSTRVNCDKILNSEGAKIFSFFSLSEAVISYFVFQLIVVGIILPFAGSNEPYLWVLMAGSVLSIPMVIYSLYYQAIKAKTWCKLCMLINGVLAVQVGILSFLWINGTISVQGVELVPFIFSSFLFLTIATSIILLKNKFQDISDSVNAEIAAKRVKNAPEVFSHLLFKGNRIDYQQDEYKMLIGNPEASLNLLMVANVNCHPCKIAYMQVLELLDQYPNQINVAFKFLMSGNNVHGIPASAYMIRYLNEFISGTENESVKIRKLIEDWYKYMSVETFEKIYTDVPKEHDRAIASHTEWITKHEIIRTPTFFLNGYEFPTQYKISDLSALVTGLVPLLEEKKSVVQKPKELV